MAMAPQAQITEERKIGKTGVIQTENVCVSKDINIKTAKRQPTEWEEIFASRIEKEIL